MNDTPWRPTASLERLRLRAGLRERLRAFFHARGVLEVETPALAAAGTVDPHIESFATRFDGPGGARNLWLQTSPEFAMKRLLTAGSGPIWQLCHVFRNGEAGRRHNPEFAMLEWYRPGLDHYALAEEVAELVAELLAGHVTVGEPRRRSYRELFLEHLALDPGTAPAPELVACAGRHGIDAAGLELDRDGWLDLLLSHLIEPQLGRGRLDIVHDFPASQAALARVRDGKPPVAERFEVYLEGMELANGFHELSDAAEQARRFEAEHAARAAAGLPEVAIDRRLLAALAAGLPGCAGVALGFDRLVMVAAGVETIGEVTAFPFDRV